MSEFIGRTESKKHKFSGRYTVKRMLIESRRHAIDGRSAEGKELKEILRDLGEKPPKAKAMLAKRLVKAETLAERLDGHIATLPIVSRRRKDVAPILITYLKLLDTIQRTAQLMGVDRVESKPLDLARRLMIEKAQADGSTK
jgi:hypothetical protein